MITPEAFKKFQKLWIKGKFKDTKTMAIMIVAPNVLVKDFDKESNLIVEIIEIKTIEHLLKN